MNKSRTTSLTREIALKIHDTAITTRETAAVAVAVDEAHTIVVTSKDRLQVRLSSLSVIAVQGGRQDITQVKYKCPADSEDSHFVFHALESMACKSHRRSMSLASTRDRKRPVQAKHHHVTLLFHGVHTVRFIPTLFMRLCTTQCTPTKRCRLQWLAVHEGLLHMPGKEVSILEFQCTCQLLLAYRSRSWEYFPPL